MEQNEVQKKKNKEKREEKRREISNTTWKYTQSRTVEMFKPRVVPICWEIRNQPVYRDTVACNPVFINHISISRPQRASQQELREPKIKGPEVAFLGVS